MLNSPIDIVENSARRVVVASLPNWGLLGAAIGFFIAAYGVGAWALATTGADSSALARMTARRPESGRNMQLQISLYPNDIPMVT